MNDPFKFGTYEEFIEYLDKNKGAKCSIFTHEDSFDYIMRVRDLPLQVKKEDGFVMIGNKNADFIDVKKENYLHVILYFGDIHHHCN